MKVELKYKTFNELLDEVSTDFSVFSMEGMIEPGQLIKVAQKVNYDLGLKIHQVKEDVIEIDHGKAKLPSDFYVMNLALMMHKYKIKAPIPMGRHTEDVLIPDTCPACEQPPQECGCPCPQKCKVSCNEQYQVVQTVKHEVRIFDETERVHLTGPHLSKRCPNRGPGCGSHGEIKNGYIYFNVKHGKLYINYEGAMEDEEGNLLVLDHPMINEYYEYALKERILQNLYMNGEPVQEKLMFIKGELRAARNYALSIVNTPDFAELKALHDMNREAMHAKYYRPFASY